MLLTAAVCTERCQHPPQAERSCWGGVGHELSCAGASHRAQTSSCCRRSSSRPCQSSCAGLRCAARRRCSSQAAPSSYSKTAIRRTHASPRASRGSSRTSRPLTRGESRTRKDVRAAANVDNPSPWAAPMRDAISRKQALFAIAWEAIIRLHCATGDPAPGNPRKPAPTGERGRPQRDPVQPLILCRVDSQRIKPGPARAGTRRRSRASTNGRRSARGLPCGRRPRTWSPSRPFA